MALVRLCLLALLSPAATGVLGQCPSDDYALVGEYCYRQTEPVIQVSKFNAFDVYMLWASTYTGRLRHLYYVMGWYR